MKIIFGFDTNYQELVENGTIETLKSRRQEASLRFALKAASSERFGHKWFKETGGTDRAVRNTTRKVYVEKHCRTERSRNNPLQAMTRQLNAHWQ